MWFAWFVWFAWYAFKSYPIFAPSREFSALFELDLNCPSSNKLENMYWEPTLDTSIGTKASLENICVVSRAYSDLYFAKLTLQKYHLF